MARNTRILSPGLAAVGKSPEVVRAITSLAERVAKNIEAQGIRVGDKDGGKAEVDLPVRVDSYTTDRARSSVTITHPAGLAVQAKHGALTKAASAEGLIVKGKR